MVDAVELENVARQVRRRRHERGWTLDSAAARLGISRRLLVQVEAGEANPSLSSLLSIASGLEIPLVDLLSEPEVPAISVRRDDAAAPVLWNGANGGEGRLLVASGGLELWQWSLQPGEERVSEPHRTGAREALSVTAGAVVITVADTDPVTLTKGQSAAFVADVAHRYANRSRRPARFTLAVHESS